MQSNKSTTGTVESGQNILLTFIYLLYFIWMSYYIIITNRYRSHEVITLPHFINLYTFKKGPYLNYGNTLSKLNKYLPYS